MPHDSRTGKSKYTIQIREDLPEGKDFQHFPQSSIIYDPLFIAGFNIWEREILKYLSFRAWQKKSLVVRAAFPFIAANTGLGRRTVARYIPSLIAKRMLTLKRVSKKYGNEYLVEPVLLARFAWDTRPLAFLEETRLFRSCQSGTTILPEIRRLLLERCPAGTSVVSPWHDYEKILGTEKCLPGTKYYLLYSLLLWDGAQRYTTTNPIRGGEEKPASVQHLKEGVLRTLSENPNKELGRSPEEIEKRRALLKDQLKTLTAREASKETQNIGPENFEEVIHEPIAIEPIPSGPPN